MEHIFGFRFKPPTGKVSWVFSVHSSSKWGVESPLLSQAVAQVLGPDFALWGCQIFCKPGAMDFVLPWCYTARGQTVEPAGQKLFLDVTCFVILLTWCFGRPVFDPRKPYEHKIRVRC